MLCELNEQTFQKNILAKPGMQRMQSPTLHSVSQVNFERDTRDDSVQQLAQLTENFKKNVSLSTATTASKDHRSLTSSLLFFLKC